MILQSVARARVKVAAKKIRKHLETGKRKKKIKKGRHTVYQKKVLKWKGQLFNLTLGLKLEIEIMRKVLDQLLLVPDHS